MKRIIKISLLIVCFLLAGICFAQNSFSILKEEKLKYSSYNLNSEKQWDSLRSQQNLGTFKKTSFQNPPCTLNKRVFGWHPYWMGSVYQNYQWNLISDFCYFDYDVSPTTGNNVNASFAWATSQAVTDAITNGVRTHICATLFGSHSTFFGSSSAQQTFITNIINLLNSRGGNGVNIDFEGMGASHTTAFTAFMQNLSTQVKAANPNYEISMALYAVDWSNVFDIQNLNPWVDTYIIMGYDYYYSGSSTAGPEAPLYNFQTSYNYTLARSLSFYLNKGVAPNDLLLGLPYYGREWETTSASAPSATTGGFTSSRTFTYVKNNSTGYYNNTNYNWEPNCFNPFYAFQVAGAWRQCWIDDGYSMKKKFDLVNMRGIGGIGIWALGYDDGYNDYWNAIQEKFSNCALVPCSDTIYDMGGPNRNYYDNENYTFTIAPQNAVQVNLNFSSFNTELNYDTLFIYDGPAITSPLIGKYHGTNSPGNINSTGNSLTLKFKSDNGTVQSGFAAIWNCIQDATAPQTQIQSINNWVTQNFTCNFTDADNVGGSGLDKSFYSVHEFNGTEWQANDSKGFLADEFNTLQSYWTNNAGLWACSGGELIQSDQNQNNSNLSTPIVQNLSNRYLYHFTLNLNGSGINRRGGLHIFADNPSLPNRGNNYLVWFRADQDKIELYKVSNDVLNLVSSFNKPIQTNTNYDIKVSFDRINGLLQTWVNDTLSAYWTDPLPFSNGSYISLRSGNCQMNTSIIEVFRSRNANVNITVGAGNTNDVRFQNLNPTTKSGRIRSIVKDNANWLSTIQQEDFNVDWTKPLISNLPNDGNSFDSDTTFNGTQLEANWSAANDPHSGISSYQIALGTNPGTQNILNWTSTGLLTQHLQNGLSLINNQIYYSSIRAVNGAGLVSDSANSDGILYLNITGIEVINNINLVLYPNPAKEYFEMSGINFVGSQIEIYNILGEKIEFERVDLNNRCKINFNENLKSGTYFIIIKKDKQFYQLKFIKV